MKLPILITFIASAIPCLAQNFFWGHAQPAVAPGGITIVSETTNYVNNTGSSLSTTIPATVAGHCLVLVGATYHGHITGCTTNGVSAGAAFQITTNMSIGNSGVLTYVEGYEIKNCGAGITTVAITTTADQGGASPMGFQSVHIFEIAGASTSAPYTGTERTASPGAINVATQDTGGQVNNGTAVSIYFAACISDGNSVIGPPPATGINASGSDGAWVELANSQMSGAVNVNLSVVTQIVTTSAARKHVWTRANNSSSTIGIEFVIHQ